MKRILSAGEGYALFPTNINYRMPRYFLAWRAPLLFVFSFFMCLEFSMAQEKQVPFDKNKYEIPSGGVVIGEKVPEWFWELGFDVVNTLGGHKTIRLKDYRHKLLV